MFLLVTFWISWNW